MIIVLENEGYLIFEAFNDISGNIVSSRKGYNGGYQELSCYKDD